MLIEIIASLAGKGVLIARAAAVTLLPFRKVVGYRNSECEAFVHLVHRAASAFLSKFAKMSSSCVLAPIVLPRVKRSGPVVFPTPPRFSQSSEASNRPLCQGPDGWRKYQESTRSFMTLNGIVSALFVTSLAPEVLFCSGSTRCGSCNRHRFLSQRL